MNGGKRQGAQREALDRAKRKGGEHAARSSARLGQPPGTEGVNVSPQVSRVFLAGMGILAVVLVIFAIGRGSAPVPAMDLSEAQVQATVAAPTPNPGALPPPTAVGAGKEVRRVGLISGHRGYDTGTVCADGYTEAQLVYETAVRTAAQLRALGYVVDILDEFDVRLRSYASSVLLSIHADSCASINDLATGFKVARSEDSVVPQEEDRLVACLNARYARSTSLRVNANTITHDMTRYHALYKIDPRTPAAIIEIGFLNLDRETLQKRNAQVARGIVDGLQCYLLREAP